MTPYRKFSWTAESLKYLEFCIAEARKAKNEGKQYQTELVSLFRLKYSEEQCPIGKSSIILKALRVENPLAYRSSVSKRTLWTQDRIAYLEDCALEAYAQYENTKFIRKNQSLFYRLLRKQFEKRYPNEFTEAAILASFNRFYKNYQFPAHIENKDAESSDGASYERDTPSDNNMVDYSEDEESEDASFKTGEMKAKRSTRIQERGSMRQLRNLTLEDQGNFLDNWTPESSHRETRKTQRKTYREGLRTNNLHDENGVHIRTGMDLCDCLEESCPGCHFPCPKCGSPKCGLECRNNRKWIYEQIEIEGTDIAFKNPLKS